MTDTNTRNLSVSNQRKFFTKRITLNLVASIVADPNFPIKENVPDSIPMPFTNFGHQPLIDHELLQRLLWNIITKMQEVLKPWKVNHYIFLSANIIFASVIFGWGYDSNNILSGIIFGLISISLGGYLISKRTDKFFEKLAEVKSTELQNLLSNNYDLIDSQISEKTIKKRMDYFGSGEIDLEQVPVLTIVDDNDPFPGYGRLQLENTFVCRPKEEMLTKPIVKEIGEIVFENVKKAVKQSRITEISSGTIITVYGDSISIDSKWLNEKKSPLLWIQREELKKFLEISDMASSRQYYAIHVLFPEYNTASTFFFRTFFAGNVASCHLAFSTIGPPILDKQYIQRVLLQYKLEKKDKEKERSG